MLEWFIGQHSSENGQIQGIDLQLVKKKPINFDRLSESLDNWCQRAFKNIKESLVSWKQRYQDICTALYICDGVRQILKIALYYFLYEEI